MFQRYAVYHTPQGALAQRGAAWLGWDITRGARVAHPQVLGLDVATLTDTPRKYGLHGTIKPPFVLADGKTPDELDRAVATLCARLVPVRLDALQVAPLSGFIALVPLGDQTPLAGMAAQVVTGLDHFRAPPTQAELARRRAANLTRAQEQHLADWGYPYVMDQFRFHITLAGRIDGDTAPVADAISAHFADSLPAPYMIDSLTLAGQGDDGMFHEIRRFALTG